VESVLNRVRYQGEVPSYAERNHVMEAQWLPHNLQKGYLRELTLELGGKAVRRVEKVLTADTWAQSAGQALALPPASQPLGTFGLDIIPVARAAAALAQAPAGAVVVVVRADRPRQVTRISHVGLLVFKQGKPWLRHASRTFKKVADEELQSFLKRNLDFASWTIEGLAVFEVQAPGGAAPPVAAEAKAALPTANAQQGAAPPAAEANGAAPRVIAPQQVAPPPAAAGKPSPVPQQ
jgi:hypothetical protein